MKKLVLVIALVLGAFINSKAQSLDFDGIDDNVVIPIVDPTTEITHEFWFRTTSPDGGLFSVTDGVTGYDRDIYLSDGNIYAYVWGLGGVPETITTTGVDYADGNWHHVAHVMGGSVIGQHLYVDGILKASATYTFSAFTINTQVSLGYSYKSQTYFKGQMDELRMWNVALTQTQIQDRMNCSIPSPLIELMANYHFNQGIANANNSGITSLVDNSGNAFHGVLADFALNGTTSNWVDNAPVSTVAVRVTANPASVGALGNTIVYTATPTNGGAAPIYQWIKNGVNVGINSATYTDGSITPADTISCTITYTGTPPVCLTNTQATSNKVTILFWGPAQSLSFDGVNDYVNCNALLLTNNTDITMECWVKWQGDTTAQQIFYNGNSGTSGYGLYLINGELNLLHGGIWAYPITTLPTNIWTHLALVNRLDTSYIYINGVPVFNAPNIAYLPAGVTTIGGQAILGESFNGSIDEVHFWNTARTQTEIQNSMSCPLTGSQMGLVANYHFNEGIANADNTGITMLIDSSGNGNNGTLINFALKNTRSNWVDGANTSVVSVNISANQVSVPAGSTVTFTAVPVNGGTAPTYQWIKNSVPISGATAATYTSNTLTSTDTIWCTIVSNALCVPNPNASSNKITLSFWGPEQALDFDGINDKVTISIQDPLTEITHEFWFRTTNPDGGLFLVTDGVTGFDRSIYMLGGNINAYVYGAGGLTETITTTGTNYADGNWHHLAHVMGASVGGQKLYVDGALVASGGFTSSAFNWNNQINLGYSPVSGMPAKFLLGQMDEVRLWSVARTQSQIQKDMHCLLTGTQVGLLANYSFNEGIPNANNAGVTTLLDASGNAYNGTLTGFALNGLTSNWVNGAGTIYPKPSITSVTGASEICTGSSTLLTVNGSATSYLWSANAGSATTNTVSVSPTGSTNYVVHASNGMCMVKDSITINLLPLPVVSATASASSICTGGSVTLTAAGADTYTWSNGVLNGVAFTPLSNNTYTVTGIDPNGCSNTATITVNVNNAIAITGITVTDATCGNNDGSATVQTSGGTLPLHYRWSNGDTVQTAANLAAGQYQIQVYDVNNCRVYGYATVNAANGPAASVLSTTPASCYGGTDGAVAISITGGISPYTILWSNGATTSSLTGIAAGPYDVTVTDSAGCTVVKSIEVLQAPKIVNTFNITSTPCAGTTGAAQANTTGGTGAYTYLWDNNAASQTTQTANNLAAGVYQLTITDANGCTITDVATVTNTASTLLASIASTNSTGCGVGMGGSAIANVTGGVAPYSFSWSNGFTNDTITNLQPGTYYCTISDANMCTVTQSTNIASASAGMTQSVCMVTVDTATFTNKIIWEKTIARGIKSFKIYRESTMQNVYTLIATVPYDSLSTCTDPVANPAIHAWRYKITALDSCNHETPYSLSHKTIHLAQNLGLGGTINLAWDYYEGFVYYTYYIWRHDPSTAWVLLDSLSANYTTYTDFAPPSLNSRYMIEVSSQSGCTPTRGAINTSRSNIKSPTSIGIKSKINNLTSEIKVYPNPATEMLNVDISTVFNGGATITLENMLGQVVYSVNTNQQINKINTSLFANGVYLVKVKTASGVSVQKVVVE